MGITADIRRMLESLKITSAGGKSTAENTVVSIDNVPDLDFQLNENDRKIDDILDSNLGDLKDLSSEQFGNIRQVAVNPFGFITTTLLKKIKSGAGILFVAAIAVEVAKFLILELFKPGRAFDIRFREEIDKQVIQFLERKEQQELRQGFKSIITTTIGGLRGDSLRGQTGGNYYTPNRIPSRFIDPSQISPPNFNARDARKKSFQDIGAGAARGRR